MGGREREDEGERTENIRRFDVATSSSLEREKEDGRGKKTKNIKD